MASTFIGGTEEDVVHSLVINSAGRRCCDNQLTLFSYDENSNPGETIITTVTDRNGRNRVLTHDSNYQLLSIRDELGNTTTYTYDTDGNRTSARDASRKITTYTYDNRGNLLSVTDPAGHVATMTYDERNNH